MEPPAAGYHAGFRSTDERSSEAFASGVIVDLAGTATACSAQPGAHAEAMAGLLADAPRHTGPAHASIHFGPADVDAPSGRPTLLQPPASWWLDGARATMTIGPVTCTFTGLAVRIGAVGDHRTLRTAFRAAYPAAVAHVLAPAGLLVVHAAAIGRAGRALVLLGRSGRGKSSVSYAAGRSGWDVLADDLCALRPPGPGRPVAVHGIPRPLAVPRPLVAGDPGPALAGDPRARVEVDVALDARWCDVAGVVEVRHGPPEGAWAWIGAIDVAHQLVEASVHAPTAAHRATAFTTAIAACRTSTWAFGHALLSDAALAPTGAALAGLWHDAHAAGGSALG
jgi:hypothetical protein